MMFQGDKGCNPFQATSGLIHRRQAIQAGALTFTGLTLPAMFARRASASDSLAKRTQFDPVAKRTQSADPLKQGFGRAKSCIVIFQWGGPSHLDTWDPKPDAPEDIRGSFSSIATATPGVRISEYFPELAKRTQSLAIIRSMTHDDPAHLSTAHRVLTGHLAPTINSDAAGPSPNDWPHLGALVARCRPSLGAMPTAVTMPWVVAHPAAPGGRAPGQNAGWLGKTFDPFAIDGDPNEPNFKVSGLDLPEGITADRFADRRSFLSQVGSPDIPGRASGTWDRMQGRALDALSSSEARTAFEIQREDPKTRDRYGRHIHGQCLLMARRLVEAGVGLVTVNWHDDHSNFWDTHGDNFNQLKDRLMPPADQGFAALLDDLADRNLLDETLVVWMGEFGRTPRISKANAGREHWPRCYSMAMAGGGIQGGIVHGASDRLGAYPSLDPFTPDDVGATILHALGIDPASELSDPLGRPLRINNGSPLTSLFG